MRTIRPAPVVALLCTVALAACSASVRAGRTSSSQGASPGDTAAIMQADRDFSADVQQRGVTAWVSWFATDGQQIAPGKQVIGHDAIREFMTGVFADPAGKLVWWPVSARIAASHDLGYTIGRYEFRRFKPDGSFEVRGTGRYMTTWRMQPDGSWKVDVDIGHPDPKPVQP